MKLVRNTTANGDGKYMLVRTRELEAYNPGGSPPFEENPVMDALELLNSEGILDDSGPSTEGEFFVIRLRDINAQAALRAYAGHARQFDEEFAAEVEELANRAGPDSPWCKWPD